MATCCFAMLANGMKIIVMEGVTGECSITEQLVKSMVAEKIS